MTDVTGWHWSPRANRESIERGGLQVGRRNRPSWWQTWPSDSVCFASTPSGAWRLSPAWHGPLGRWDLWRLWLPADAVEEVRPGRFVTRSDVPASRVALVCHRTVRERRPVRGRPGAWMATAEAVPDLVPLLPVGEARVVAYERDSGPRAGDECGVVGCSEVLADEERAFQVVQLPPPTEGAEGPWVCWRHISYVGGGAV